jgi:hypothetical protein
MPQAALSGPRNGRHHEHRGTPYATGDTGAQRTTRINHSSQTSPLWIHARLRLVRSPCLHMHPTPKKPTTILRSPLKMVYRDNTQMSPPVLQIRDRKSSARKPQYFRETRSRSEGRQVNDNLGYRVRTVPSWKVSRRGFMSVS